MNWRLCSRSQLLIGLLCCLLVITFTKADEPKSQLDAVGLQKYSHIWAEPGGKFHVLTDDILPVYKPRFEGWLALPEYYQWKRELSAEHGLDYIVLAAPLFQVGSVDSKVYIDHEIDVLANWRLVETAKRKGELFFWALWVHTYSDLPTGAFAASQGLLSGPNGGSTDPDKDFVALSALFWQETFKHDASESLLRFGHLHASSTWATLDYLSDDRSYFISEPLSSLSGINWVNSNRGLGAAAAYDVGSWYLSAGFADAKGSQKYPDFESFSDGKFKYIAELGFRTKPGGRAGEYKITPSYTARTGDTDAPADRSGAGLILTARQEMADNMVAFAQYRRSWDRAVGVFDRFFTTGLMVDPPLGWTDDLTGIAVFYGHPIDPLDREEYGFEAFYRLQLTYRLDITPDLQVYRAGRATRTDDTVVVAGVRLRLLF